LIALLVTRWVWRQWLVGQRRQGQWSSRTVVVGSRTSVAAILRQLRDVSPSEFIVTGVCLLDTSAARNENAATEAEDDLDWLGAPVVSNLDEVVGLLASTESDTVLVTSTDLLPPEKVRDLSWRLRPGEHHIVVAPSLMDIGGPRIHTRPVAGLPLLHIETPRHGGPKRAVKRLFDVGAAVLLVVLLSPLFIALAVAIRMASPGHVLFVQERVGAGGRTFRMVKFRSMVSDAEQRVAELLTESRDSGNEVLFKMTDDPRVTPVGRFIRRWSLDELPQLLNVIAGTMSLVGPRPPLQREVDAYELHVHRRFFVKPGITGLWQISGRSSLTWEESVRLDLYYVENWSLTVDLIILWRTFAAVMRRDGAY
jgi:exopolysaccharide biosynthesis polyprenyl glycosylphosphotransferase